LLLLKADNLRAEGTRNSWIRKVLLWALISADPSRLARGQVIRHREVGQEST